MKGGFLSSSVDAFVVEAAKKIGHLPANRPSDQLSARTPPVIVPRVTARGEP
jgi:hypothetical protein